MSAAVLVDTSVWISHLSRRDPHLAERLGSLPLYTHEFILGELILGFIPRNQPALDELAVLPRLSTLPHDEVVQFVRSKRLEGAGIGWADAHLIAAAKAFGAVMWTLDKHLTKAAQRADLACLG